MNSKETLSNLKIDLGVKSRALAKNTILNEGISADELIQFIGNSKERTQILFSCVLDDIIDDHRNYLNNSLDEFISLQAIFTNETCKRVTSRIIYHLLLDDNARFDKKQKNKLIDIHFDWLINNSLVATRANCLSILFELRHDAPWITPELIAIIDQQVVMQEPAFVSRAKKILKKIAKE